MYPDILKTLSRKIENYLSEIEANYNFDLGPEFEIALCRIFQKVLPSRFGVCRGFVIDRKGRKAGDDIVIYDKLRFPTLRMLDEDFAQKECVPFEAVYACFEAKHNLELDTDLEKSSFNKAINQIKQIRTLDRPKRSLNKITDNINLENRTANPIEGWPNYFNPLFTGVLSRKASINENDQKEGIDKGELNQELSYKFLCKKIEAEFGVNWPDIIVVGTGVLAMPTYTLPDKNIIVPFVDAENHKPLRVVKTKYNALALGICNILRALEFINLDSMPWEAVLVNGICDEHRKSR